MSTADRSEATAHIAHQWVDGVMVIRPVGALDPHLAAELRHAAISARLPVIIDLTDSVLAHPAPLHHLAADWELYRPTMCLVSSREGGRQLLHLAGVDEHMTIYEDVADAIEAGHDRWMRQRPLIDRHFERPGDSSI